MSTKQKKGQYNFQAIETKWRSHWEEEKTYQTPGPGDLGFDVSKPKCYILDMFPYPSGAGLHIGHPKGYIASDIYSRYKRMQGFNVLHPMGFDSFGLPAEQYAIEHNIHPATVTDQNIDAMRSQLQFLGLSFDWTREVVTSRASYYGWTQWIFAQLFESYFDEDEIWEDGNGRQIKGRAKPIADLEAQFAAGRSLSAVDRQVLGTDKVWSALTSAERQAVLNNYRLAYQQEAVVNWCPGLGTVLANEEVTNEGRSERGDFPVYRKPLRQWTMRITAYAERLLEDLDFELEDRNGTPFRLDWPEPIKRMQRNWIGRSEGAEVSFDVLDPQSDEVVRQLPVFTTRPDTLFGATFMAIAPQHPLVDPAEGAYLVPSAWPDGTPERWKGGGESIREAVSQYVAQVAVSTADETKEKTGIFSGIYARNPVNEQKIPIFVADYVSMDYGAGAIMAVPAHDERDFAFATAYNLDIVKVVTGEEGRAEGWYAGEGTAINSPPVRGGDNPYVINGLATVDAQAQIIDALVAQGRGQAEVNYKLRDWTFARQRYWGEPFPLATHPDGYSVAVEPPVALPDLEDFRPETSDDPTQPVSPPLHRAGTEWTTVEIDGMACQRELNVMPQWAGSCWYYLRFIDPHNEEAFCDPAKEGYFMPVDLYIGGAEHAVLHLLYARFWHKALYDLGHVSTPEPFKKLFNQGMMTADAFQDERGVYIDIREVEFRDGKPVEKATGKVLRRSFGKMGKRYKNGLPPEEVGEEFGVDTLRLYEMYMGPLEASAPWSMEGIRGMQRFLQRVWRNFVDSDRRVKIGESAALAPDLERKLHQTIQKVTEDIEGLRFNTAIAALIELNNQLVSSDEVPQAVARPFLILLSPFAPHVAEELWELAGFGRGNLSRQSWPYWDAAKAAEDMIVVPIQVNGKMRGQVEVPVSTEEDAIKSLVLDMESIQKYVADEAAIKRFIWVPDKIVNIVV
ncbi:MAG: leucine--tRNA ligase [Gemmatimonadetes bacterium]|nr:leucine--tRNA ligase [Gemmatimonadota bacterium]